MKNYANRILLWTLLHQTCLALPALAYESDQFIDRDVALSDATNLLNEAVNAEFANLAAEWDGEKWGEDRFRFARQLAHRFDRGGMVGAFQKWIHHNDAIEKQILGRDSVYGSTGFYAGHLLWFTQLGIGMSAAPNVQVAGVRLGTDKIDHFFGEGFDYYRKAVIKGRGIASALRWGEKTERQIYGYWASGVYSNSDLVSNYEGLRFYLGLYEDTVGATGKALPALFAWAGDHWELRRTFDWRDYVNPLWDEVILPSGYIKPLRRTLREELARLCDRYARSPALWQPASPDFIAAFDYAEIQFVTDRAVTVAEVCDNQ